MGRRLVTALFVVLTSLCLLAPAGETVRIPNPPPPGGGDHRAITTIPAYCGVGGYYTLETTTGRKGPGVEGSPYALTMAWNDKIGRASCRERV